MVLDTDLQWAAGIVEIMGLSIGNVGGILGALRASPQFGQTRLSGNGIGVPRPNSRGDDETVGAFFRRREEPPLRAGFGAGSLSPSGAALLTINRTIEQVQRNIPTIEEIREQFRARSSEAADRTTRLGFGREESQPGPTIEVRLPVEAAQAQNAIGAINDRTRAALRELSGEESLRSEGGPTIRIGDEEFSFGNAAPGSRFDVRV